MDGTLVYDMFGSLSDDPLIRMARQQQYNRANAEEFASARLGDLRPWETPEAVEEEVYSQWGLMPPGVNTSGKFIKSGSTILSPNAQGGLDPVYDTTQNDRQAKIDMMELAGAQQRLNALAKSPPQRERDKAVWESQKREAETIRDTILAKYQRATQSQSPLAQGSGFMGIAPPGIGRDMSFTPPSAGTMDFGGNSTNIFSNAFERGLRMGSGGSTNSGVRVTGIRQR